MDWLVDRFKEKTSWTGIIVVVSALLVLFGVFPLTEMALFGVVAWGVYSFWKSD